MHQQPYAAHRQNQPPPAAIPAQRVTHVPPPSVPQSALLNLPKPMSTLQYSDTPAWSNAGGRPASPVKLGSVFPANYNPLQPTPAKGLDFAAIVHMNPGEDMLRYVQVNTCRSLFCGRARTLQCVKSVRPEHINPQNQSDQTTLKRKISQARILQ